MKKRFVSLVIILISFVLTGCDGSSVRLFYMPGENSTIYYLEVVLSNTMIDKFDDSANNGGVLRDKYLLCGDEAKKGTPYTIVEYITLLLSTAPDLTNTYVEAVEGGMVLQFRTEVLNVENDIFVQKAPSIEKNLFLYTIKSESENPFTPFYNEYKEAEGKDICNTVVQTLQNGKWSLKNIPSSDIEQIEQSLNDGWVLTSTPNLYRRDILPSLAEAFPIAASYDPKLLETIFYFVTSYNLSTSGVKHNDDSGNYYYEFSSLLGSDEPIYYQYSRANTIGWNLVAILVGLMVVGLIYLYAKYAKKPKKPTAQQAYKELHPYDPFDESGSGGNPFEGY